MQSHTLFWRGFIALLLLLPALTYAQDRGFNYQAVARDGSGNLQANQALTIGFLIHEGAAAGPVVYEETHSVNTNAYGLFDAVIGAGSPVSGTFATIDWATAAYYLEVRLNGNALGTEELVEVPYAKVATGMDLADLNDVSDVAPNSGDVLQWDGSNWGPGTSGGDWLTTGTTLYYDAGRVFVGRNNAITTAEYFGVRTPTGANTFGGMYIETENANGQPFYGYATNGTARAWTHWHGADSSLRLYNLGNRSIVTRDGRYGFETFSPEADMHLVHRTITSAATQAGFRGLKIENSGPNNNDWTFYVQNNIADLYLYYETTALGRFDDVSGAYSTISDARLKTGVQDLPPVLGQVLSLPVHSYRYHHQKPEDQSRSLGFFAQDVLSRFPELVTSTEQDGGEGVHMVNYAGFAPITVKAIQEQQALIEAQAQRIEALEARLQALEARLD